MKKIDLTDGMVAKDDDSRIERARLQQEIARLEQIERVLQGGICPLSGERPEYCAQHQERHVPRLRANGVALAALRKQEKKYTAA